MEGSNVPLESDATLALLSQGEVTSCQMVPQGSNYTFLAVVQGGDGASLRAIYKPCRGEAPLWDFPDGTLYLREYAAYLVAEALGWHFIPPTLIREGPHGIGSVQLFVEHDQRESYFSLRDSGRYTFELQRICLFDWLANNADRKAGHCLLGRDGRVWGIDQGLTFNVAYRLRTVIWDFATEPVPEELLADVERLLASLERPDEVEAALCQVLNGAEVEALKGRLRHILASKVFAVPGPHRSVPWPMF